MKEIKELFLGWILSCMLLSCGSVKDIAYLQGDKLLAKTAMVDTFYLKIQKDDLLDISVSCVDPELLRPFLQYGNGVDGGGSNYGYSGGNNNKGYLVEVDDQLSIARASKSGWFDPTASGRFDSE